jgi:hypothetical protein
VAEGGDRLTALISEVSKSSEFSKSGRKLDSIHSCELSNQEAAARRTEEIGSFGPLPRSRQCRTPTTVPIILS